MQRDLLRRIADRGPINNRVRNRLPNTRPVHPKLGQAKYPGAITKFMQKNRVYAVTGTFVAILNLSKKTALWKTHKF